MTTPADKTVVATSDLDLGGPSAVPAKGLPVSLAPTPKASSTSPIPDVVIEKELGRGGMGVVFKGHQPYLDRNVAVKLLLIDPSKRDGEYLKRFQREAKILAGLSHPHIVACYSAGSTSDGNPYLVMEFIDGPNLRDHVVKHGPLRETEAVRVIRELALGLEHAQEKGIIHRDVKPENVLLAKREGDGAFPFSAKLVDLGLARPAERISDASGNLTMQGQVLGTPATMAPEQFEDPEGVDHRADIYGLGCVLFYCLTSQSAFTGNTIAQIVRDKVAGAAPDPAKLRGEVSPGVARLARDLMAREKHQRPQTYRNLVERCDAILAGRSGSGSNLTLIIGGAVAAVVILAAGLWLLNPGGKSSQAAQAPTQPTTSKAPLDKLPALAPNRTAEVQKLLGFGIGDRLKGWTVSDGGRWSAAEERDGAVSGLSGWISRPVDNAPFVLRGVLHLANSATAKTDTVNVGVVLGDGSTISFALKNLGGNFLLAIETTQKPGSTPNQIQGPQVVEPAADLPFTLALTADTITVSAGGAPLGPAGRKPFPVTAAYIAVISETTANAPCDVSKLEITYQ